MFENKHPDESILNECLDGELAPEQRAALEAHLESCPGCQERLAQMRSLFQVLEQLPDLPLERDLTPHVLAALAPQELSRPGISPALWLLFAFQFTIAGLSFLFAWPLISRRLSVGLGANFREWGARFIHRYLDAWSAQATSLQQAAHAFMVGIVDAWEQMAGEAFWMQFSILELTILLVAVSVLWLAGNSLLLGPERSGRGYPDLKRRNP